MAEQEYRAAQQKIAAAEQAIKDAKTVKQLIAARDELEFWENKASFFWSQILFQSGALEA